MPIYEYRCTQCQKKSSVFVRSMTATTDAACQHCGSRSLRRLFSTFAVHRSAGGPDDDLGGAELDGMDDMDGPSMAKMMRKYGGDLRDEVGPEFDDMVERMEAGENPDDVLTEDGGDEGDVGGGEDME